MRRETVDNQRELLSLEVLSVDYHEFIRLAPLLTDSEMANEFHVDVRDAALVRAKLQRS